MLDFQSLSVANSSFGDIAGMTPCWTLTALGPLRVQPPFNNGSRKKARMIAKLVVSTVVLAQIPFDAAVTTSKKMEGMIAEPAQ
jgi:hypothetical protein